MNISRSSQQRMRASSKTRRNPVELLVVNPGNPGQNASRGLRAKRTLVPNTKRKTPMARSKAKRNSRRRRNPSPAQLRARAAFAARARAMRRNPSPAALAMANVIRNAAKKPAAKKTAAKKAKKAAAKKPAAKKPAAKKAKKAAAKKPAAKKPAAKKAAAKKRKKPAAKKRKKSKGKKRKARRGLMVVKASALHRLRYNGLRKNALSKAMHYKSNPGNIMATVKEIAPQALYGAASMLGAALVGASLANMFTREKPDTAGVSAPKKGFADAQDPSKLNMLGTYLPSIITASTAVGLYAVANKIAPKYKGAIIIGGMLAAIVQAISAAAGLNPTGALGKAKTAFLGDYTTVGFGDYTTVGQRAYAEAGIFRNIGDYTTVGGQDDTTEFAHDSLRGMDDTTEFARGEGGVLSGGMFRGPDSE